jgi:DNA (cytosine-5)-methyltransferase 1
VRDLEQDAIEGWIMAKTTMRPKATNDTKRVNSFFAGIGGFDLAFEKNGFAPTFYCENNDFCRSVLKRHWPSVSNADDIRKLDAADVPSADVWTAGFPCQDLSLARTPHGKRNGLKGSQSGLFYTFLELLSVHKPPVVLLENVAGLLNSHKGADFKALVGSLTQLGYAVAWRVLNARYFGAPQSRPRVFISAWRDSPTEAVKALFEDDIAKKPKNERHGFMTESKCQASGISVPQVSFCISATSGRHTGLDWARSYVTYRNAVRRLTPLECERLQGLPDSWTMPDKDYVIPIRGIETSRYHAVGNAVCVPVVDWIAGRIRNRLHSLISELSDPTALPVDKQLLYLAQTHMSPDSEVQQVATKSEDLKWKSGGVAYKDWFVTVPVSSSPIAATTSRLIDVIERTRVHERYFLSPNAIHGILRRVDKLGRHLFPPLDAVLREIATSSLADDSDGQAMRDNIDTKVVVAL